MKALRNRTNAQKRVLWLPYSQRGSIYPVAPLVNELINRGHEVISLGTPLAEDISVKLGTHFVPYDIDLEYDWDDPERFDQHVLGPKSMGKDWFEKRVSSEFETIERAIDKYSPDIILSDSFVIAGKLAAEKLQIPCVSYIHYLFDEGANTDDMFLNWWEQFGSSQKDYINWWNSIRSRVGLNPERRSVEEAVWYRMSSELTLLLGHPLLRRGNRPLPSYVVRSSIHPWDDAKSNIFLDQVTEGLSPEKPTLLVANSSAWQNDLELIQVVGDAIAGKNIQAIATVSARHSISNLNLPPNVTCVGYAPHSQLLPKVHAVVTTGGYGLTSKSLVQGLPVVIAPVARDSNYVSDAIVANGFGVRVRWPLQVKEMIEAIQTALHNKGLHQRCRNAAAAVKSYPSVVDLAGRVENIELVAELAVRTDPGEVVLGT